MKGLILAFFLLLAGPLLSDSLTPTATFRAFLPVQLKSFLPELLARLESKPWIACQEAQDGMASTSVQFALTGKNLTTIDPTFLDELPASKLHIVVACQEEDPVQSILSGYKAAQKTIESVLSTWEYLGNHLPSDNNNISFIVSTASTSRKERGKLRTVALELSEALSSQFGWTICKDMHPTLLFQFSQSETTKKSNMYRLELVSLVRVFPLRASSSSRRRPKRIESFFVAKTAHIQPRDIVLDPMCKRATFLIEAAKYWPLAASYIGVDDNIANLEHAKMNADSTQTSLTLLQGRPQQDRLATTTIIEAQSVDKILTCLPFEKSLSFYRRLIQEWSRVLRTGGRMNLVIDQRTLEVLKDAIQQADCSCSVSFVRSPSFLWGTQRVTLVVVEKTILSNPSSSRTTKSGRFDWERQSSSSSSSSEGETNEKVAWARIRSQTIPHLVPFSKRQQAVLSPNKIVLTNDRVLA